MDGGTASCTPQKVCSGHTRGNKRCAWWNRRTGGLVTQERTKGSHYLSSQWVECRSGHLQLWWHFPGQQYSWTDEPVHIPVKKKLIVLRHKGAERGAILYTIALTCRMHKVNLFKYLTDVINRTAEWQPNTPLEKYRELLPDKWEKENS